MFVVCGEALWDLFAAESEHGVTFDARIGGSPLNVAVGLRRMGQPSALLTGLSTDRLGERIRDVLVREDVDTRLLVSMPNPTTLSLVDVGRDGSPVYAFYGQDAADRSLDRLNMPALPPESWGVHAGSYSLAVEPVGSSLLSMLQQEGGRLLTTLDPNVRLNVEPDILHWRSRMDDFAARSDLIKASDEDIDLLYPGTTHGTVASRWLEAGATVVVITLGPDGARAFGPFGHVEVPCVRVDVVDTVGAGDSFQAALIAGLAEQEVTDSRKLGALGPERIARLVQFANDAAAMTCRRRGADLPFRADIGDRGGAAA